MLDLWNLFEIAGTVSFAVSGAIVGMVKNMDVFGITVLAVLTAVGGGMIRDVLAGYTPPMALENPGNLLLAVLTALSISWLFASYRIAGRKRQILTFFYIAADTVGLASFTVTGTLTGLAQGKPHTFVYPHYAGTFDSGRGRGAPGPDGPAGAQCPEYGCICHRFPGREFDHVSVLAL